MDPGATGPLSLILAVYGAIIATLVALWNIYQHVVTHRGNLKLSLRVTTEDTIWFKVVNMGHRPVWLHAIGGRNKMGSPERLFHVLYSPLRNLPVKLEPGEEFDDTSVHLKKINLELVRYFCAWDSKGKVHKAPKRQLQDVIEGGGEKP